MIGNVTALTFALALLAAQEHQHSMPGMHHMQDDAVQQFLMQQASGTSADPAATPHEHLMTSYDQWMLMAHGLAFVSQVVQTGPRGDDAFFSTNWVMGMADRPLAGGHLMLRSMLSLEPLTVPGGGYPELFQTGETFNGQPIVDAQHPHNFFMELAAEFAIDAFVAKDTDPNWSRKDSWFWTQPAVYENAYVRVIATKDVGAGMRQPLAR